VESVGLRNKRLVPNSRDFDNPADGQCVTEEYKEGTCRRNWRRSVKSDCNGKVSGEIGELCHAS
jgi:hypothetical protein